MARKGPNVSQYIANLNTVGDVNDDLFRQNDLSSFATTEFFDFDMGDNSLGSLRAPADFDTNRTDRKQSSVTWEDPLTSDFLGGTYSITIILSIHLYFSTYSHSIFIFQLQLYCTLSIEQLITFSIGCPTLHSAISRISLHPT
jgi:hypothetical protein